jgi:hypothetical protein
MSIRGKDARIVEDLGTIPRPAGQISQITFDAIDRDHVAFVFSLTNGEAASNRWRLYVWDRNAHRMALVASNPIDSQGHALLGGWVHPVLTARYLYWIQAAPDSTGWGGSALMQYAFATGHTRTLYRGLAEALVPYGRVVLFTALIPGSKPPAVDTGQGPPATVYAIEQDSGQRVPAPAGITAGHDGADFMQTDGDLIVWNANDNALHAWRPEWGHSVVLVPDFSSWPLARKLGMADPQMPRLYGHFVVFSSGSVWILDLKTNSIARLTDVTVGEDMSGSELQLQEYSSSHSYDRATGRIQTDEYLIDLAKVPDLPGCPKS